MKFESKEEVRRFVWKRIEPFSIPPFPVTGRIPNFKGSKRACERIRELEEYKKSRTVFSAPDSPLTTARKIVLEDGKNLLAVKPRITGFLLLEGRKDVAIKDVTIKGMIRNGVEIRESELSKVRKVDVFIQGCVAVDIMGNRVGKGSGYGDKEYEILKKHELIKEPKDCLYVVIAHEVQIFEDLSHLMGKHDVKADVILTPKKIIRCS
ncbi:5-formyltetrahydrofolate cyclo-ligase [Archaeoglobales archaeon]|nr:MAG: 5-formyltetrahydrofolate cyclo-ligase [Archaeoglobales archaeon]